ncbi:unnamed protein product [Vicia faba]|uniref:Uncharacterized protein n=1 Tax=Vicia faba TaxID=3906 RepID=A0AAV0ZZC9_VICFA|nr:unnamed protein product [Vicia faba]
MRMISITFIYFSSIMVMLPSTTYSQTLMSPKVNQSATYMSQWFEVGPGEVASKLMFDIDFARGHIGVKSFDVDLVDEQGKSVPLHEAYLHHYFAIKDIVKKNMPLSHNHNDHIKPFGDPILKRNDGICNGVEHGNPANTPEGWEEKWIFTLMVIDTRGTENKRSCTESRRRKLALRYKVTWVDWDQHQIPVRFYILDSADRVLINGSQIIHDCLTEYTIPKSNSILSMFKKQVFL